MLTPAQLHAHPLLPVPASRPRTSLLPVSGLVRAMQVGPQSRSQPSLMGISSTDTLGESARYWRASSEVWQGGAGRY